MHAGICRDRSRVGAVIRTHSPPCHRFCPGASAAALPCEGLLRFGIAEAIDVLEREQQRMAQFGSGV